VVLTFVFVTVILFATHKQPFKGRPAWPSAWLWSWST